MKLRRLEKLIIILCVFLILVSCSDTSNSTSSIASNNSYQSSSLHENSISQPSPHVMTDSVSPDSTDAIMILDNGEISKTYMEMAASVLADDSVECVFYEQVNTLLLKTSFDYSDAELTMFRLTTLVMPLGLSVNQDIDMILIEFGGGILLAVNIKDNHNILTYFKPNIDEPSNDQLKNAYLSSEMFQLFGIEDDTGNMDSLIDEVMEIFNKK